MSNRNSNTEKIKDFLIITDDLVPNENFRISPNIKEEFIGIVFYAEGNVTVNVSYGRKNKEFLKTKGVSSSFYVDPVETSVIHKISNSSPLKRVTLLLSPTKMKELLSEGENENFNHLNSILSPNDSFIEGPKTNVIPEMQVAINKILNCQYTGIARNLLLESQVVELVAHYLNQLDNKSKQDSKIKAGDIEKLHYAKELLLTKIANPPSLFELSKAAGINTYKLKKGFKEIFGEPVYKYLQSERLNKAFDLISNKDVSIQEAAWFVGYESISSFSNAFFKKFGFRPSDSKK